MADDKQDDGRQKHVIGKPTVGAPGLTQIPPVKQPEQAEEDKRKEEKEDGK